MAFERPRFENLQTAVLLKQEREYTRLLLIVACFVRVVADDCLCQKLAEVQEGYRFIQEELAERGQKKGNV